METSWSFSVVIQQLDSLLSKLEQHGNEKAVSSSMMSDISNLIKGFDLINCGKGELELAKFCDMITDLIMIAETLGKEVKRFLFFSMTHKFVDFLLKPQHSVVKKLEILKNLNLLLQYCHSTEKHKFLSQKKFHEKLRDLYKSVFEAGDFELQACIVESLFRLIPKDSRPLITKEYIQGDKLTEFLSIRDGHFEMDCRRFLNSINKSTDGCRRVFSFPAESVELDGEKLIKPLDEGYDDFWIDFNIGSKRIGIFCEPTALSSQISQGSDQMWETVSVWAHDVKQYSCKVTDDLWTASIELKSGSRILSSRHSEQSHLVIITMLKSFDLKTVLDQIFEKTVKVSSAIKPVQVCTVDQVSQKVTEIKDHPHQSPQPSKSCREKKLNAMNASKASVPSEPMTTPANTVTTSDFSEVVSWEKLQDKLRKQNSNVQTNVTESSISKKSCTSAVEGKKVKKVNVSKVSIPSKSMDVPASTVTTSNLGEALNWKQLHDKQKSHLTDQVSESLVSTNERCTRSSQRTKMKNNPNTTLILSEEEKKLNKKETNSKPFSVQNSKKENEPNGTRGNKQYEISCSSKYQNNLQTVGKKDQQQRQEKELFTDTVLTPKHSEKTQASARASKKCTDMRKQKLSDTKNESFGDVSLNRSAIREGGDNNLSLQKSEDGDIKNGEKVDNGIEKDLTSQTNPNILKKWKNRSKKQRKQVKTIYLRSLSRKDTEVANQGLGGTTPRTPLAATLRSEKRVKTPVVTFHTEKANRLLNFEKDSEYESRDCQPAVQIIPDSHPSTFRKVEEGPESQREQKGNEKKRVCNEVHEILVTNGSGETFHENVPEKETEGCSISIIPAGKKIHKSKRHRSPGNISLDDFKMIKPFKMKKLDTVKNISAAQDKYNKNKANIKEMETCGRKIEAKKQCIKDVSENPKSFDIKKYSASEVSSSYSEYALCIETVPSRKIEDEIVAETQIDVLTQEAETKRQKYNGKSFNSPKMINKALSSNDSVQVSSNLENSHIFHKKIEKGPRCKEMWQENFKVTTEDTNESIEKDNALIEQDNKVSSGSDLSLNVERQTDTCQISKNNSAEGDSKVTSSNNEVRNQATADGCNNEVTSTRNLRARKKYINYKEWDSYEKSSTTDDIYAAHKYMKLHKNSTKGTSKNDVKLKRTYTDKNLPEWDHLESVTPDGHSRIRELGEDKSSNKVGTLAPKKAFPSSNKSKHWESKKIEKTITKLSYSNYVPEHTIDPYDFDADCESRSKSEAEFVVPFRSASFQSCSSDKNKHDKQKPKKKGFCCTRNLTSTQDYLHVSQSSQVTHSTFTHYIDKHNSTKESKCHTSSAMSRKFTKSGSPHKKKLKTKTKNESKVSDCASESSSKFKLFASQLESENSALEFPPLNDSLTWTPNAAEYGIGEKEKRPSDRKSNASELSWLTVAKYPSQQKGTSKKTYDKKVCQDQRITSGTACKRQTESNSCIISDNEIEDFVSLNSDIEETPVRLRNMVSDSLTLNELSKYMKSPWPHTGESASKKRINIISNRDLPYDSCQSNSSNAEENDFLPSNDCQWKNEALETQDAGSEVTDESQSDTVDFSSKNIAAQPDNGSEKLRKDCMWNSSPHENVGYRTEPFQSKIKNMPGRMKRDLLATDTASGLKSGPSSTIRPTHHELKRKYPNMSPFSEGDTNDVMSYDDDYHSTSKLEPKKLFRSEKTPSKVSKGKSGTKQSSVQNQKTIKALSSASPESILRSDKKQRTSVTKPQISFSLYSSSTLSPEIGRGNRLTNSPFPSTTNDSSLLPLESVELSDSEEECTVQQNYLQNRIKTTKKQSMSQNSEGSSENSDQVQVPVSFSSGKGGKINKIKKSKPELQGTLKSTYKCINSAWGNERSKRSVAVDKFQNVATQIFDKIIQDLKELDDSKMKISLAWEQHMQSLEKHSQCQKKELKRLKVAHRDLISDLQEIEKEENKTQKTLKSAMKSDMDALQNKLLAKFNEHSLEAMKRCIQTSIMSS